MKGHIRRFIRECVVCQKNKVSQVKPAGLLSPLPIPRHVWMDISMDFVDGFPTSRGNSTIFVVVDRLSKYSHFIPIKHPYMATTVAQTFLDHIFKLHGMAESIVCDCDLVFTSSFWKNLFLLNSILAQLITHKPMVNQGGQQDVGDVLAMFHEF